jgi:hypothetical protein
MYIDNSQSEYEDFLRENREFWVANAMPDVRSRGHIFVDMCHDHPGYLLANLWCAKYIQRVQGGSLIGVASRWDKACPHYHIDRLRELAMSFLLDDFIDLDETFREDGETLDELGSLLRRHEGAELRKAILSLDTARDPDLGWILYDTWLRQERTASFETGNSEMLDCARTVLHVRRAVREAMAEAPVSAAVVGHYHYSPYSFIALEAARRSAPVYFQSLLTPCSLRRFASLDDVRRGRPSDFPTVYRDYFLPRIQPDHLAQMAQRYFSIQAGSRHFLKSAKRMQSVKSREDYLLEYELDPALPTVCFYAPALCAPTHCYGPFMFDDNGDWLQKSLAFAATVQRVNYLVKRHPQDETFDTQNLIGSLAQVYGGVKNIHFISAPIAAAQMAALCDLVVTVSGTPAYEMAAHGVRTVASGPSRYSGLAFADEPKTQQEYYGLLANVERRALDEQRRIAALQFAFLELAAGRSKSYFLPPLHRVSTAEFWEEGVRNLRAGWISEDPLYRNIQLMITRDMPMLFNADILETE